MSADALECDVLVIGGGSTACMAAISAHDAGAHVIVVSKGEIGNSGSSARAGGVIAAALPPELTNATDDTPDRHFADTLDVGCGLSSEAHVRHLADRSPQIVLQLDRMGIPFSKDQERFHQIQLIGNTRERGASVIGGGAELMRKLRAELTHRKITLLEGYGATDLVRTQDRVTGAVFQNTATNSHLEIMSRETILACGGASGLFRTISGDRANTGDGIALAYKAGAEIANAEFIEFTLIFKVGTKVLPIAGLSPL